VTAQDQWVYFKGGRTGRVKRQEMETQMQIKVQKGDRVKEPVWTRGVKVSYGVRQLHHHTGHCTMVQYRSLANHYMGYRENQLMRFECGMGFVFAP
jgi:hypothetical protein